MFLACQFRQGGAVQSVPPHALNCPRQIFTVHQFGQVGLNKGQYTLTASSPIVRCVSAVGRASAGNRLLSNCAMRFRRWASCAGDRAPHYLRCAGRAVCSVFPLAIRPQGLQAHTSQGRVQGGTCPLVDDAYTQHIFICPVACLPIWVERMIFILQVDLYIDRTGSWTCLKENKIKVHGDLNYGGA